MFFSILTQLSPLVNGGICRIRSRENDEDPKDDAPRFVVRFRSEHAQRVQHAVRKNARHDASGADEQHDNHEADRFGDGADTERIPLLADERKRGADDLLSGKFNAGRHTILSSQHPMCCFANSKPAADKTGRRFALCFTRISFSYRSKDREPRPPR